MRFPSEFPKDLKNYLHQDVEWIGLRFVREKTSHRSVRDERPERNATFIDEGVMIEVLVDGHFGHLGTSDSSPEGLSRAVQKAIEVTRASSARKVFSFMVAHRPPAAGEFISPRKQPLDQASLEEMTAVMIEATRAMKVSERIVNRHSSAMLVETETCFVSSNGSATSSQVDHVAFNLAATAGKNSENQTRSLNGWLSHSYQMGAEAFNRERSQQDAHRIAAEAVELLSAENCPTEALDLILMPDQMMLQIHESIGHPLELDRILGDERNYAGWSFVKPEDFGKLQYGSKLMNVTFDPTRVGEFASYRFDDGGNEAKKEFLIQDGVLRRGLGSLESQSRLNLPGVANFRSASWNRAPIDRMANINVEAGSSSLEEMISSVRRGVLMHSNRAWSIDDERNKFQFGCEYAKLIENGRFTRTLKNPNYRGTTVDFWNRLAAVGGRETIETYGTPYCGKGEPSQVIRVGHASPPCLFKNVEVFGGGQ